jgi:capsular exopolysaccharide synthesis family protein
MTEPYSPAFDQGDDGPLTIAGLTPREAVAAIRRRWWLVAGVVAVVMAVGLWRTLRQPRIYRAAATVRVQQARPAFSTQPTYQSYDPRLDPLLSEQQVIRSQTVAEGVVDDLGLRLQIREPANLTRTELFGDNPPHVDSATAATTFVLTLKPVSYSLSAGRTTYGEAPYGTALSGGGVSVKVDNRPDVEKDRVVLQVVPRGSAALGVRAGIETKVLPQTDIIEISYEGMEPAAVRDIVNAVAATYQTFSTARQRESAKEKSKVTRVAVDSQAVALKRAQDELEDFKRRCMCGDVLSERTALEESIHKLEEDRQALDVERKIYGALVGKVAEADTTDTELRRLTGTEAISKNTHIANLFNRWFDLEKTLAQLRAEGKNERNTDVRATYSTIARTKEDLQAASAQYLQALETRIQSINAQIAENRRTLENFPPLEAEQLRLQSNVTTAQQLFAQLQSSLQVNRINEADDGGRVQLIDAAVTPSFAISPNRKRDAMFSLAVGLLIGVALALLLERLDDTVKSPDELREKMDVTVIGLIPAIDTVDADAGVLSPTIGRLVTHADPRSPVAEAYRSLRTNLAFARTTQPVQTIVVASPGPGDGKSTTAANLAITFAQQGQRTLLIDADMRRAVLDKTFGMVRTPGLTDVIVGSAPLETAVRETQVPNLFVLPSGQFPPNPSELLGSPAMRETLRTARHQFDIVLFDSPPLLAVTDAAVLSTLVDGTILVVRTSSTAREAVRRALSQLRAVNGRILGAVLNDVDVRGRGYYGGYGYYYYSYGPDGHGDGNGRPTGFVDRVRKLAGRGAGR